MERVVKGNNGTARNYQIGSKKVEMAGKTGTVQVVRISEAEREKDRRGGTFQDIMSVDWDQTAVPEKTITSSARTPNTQTIFGNYSPMPNSMRYRVPYELVLKQKNKSILDYGSGNNSFLESCNKLKK